MTQADVTWAAEFFFGPTKYLICGADLLSSAQLDKQKTSNPSWPKHV